MRTHLLVLGIICLIPTIGPVAQDKTGPTPDQAWQRLKDGNQKFAADKLEAKDFSAKKREELAKGQKPFAIVLTCADSRVVPELIFNQGLGDMFVVRVAGNIGDPFTLASIEYAVEHLHVPLIVVLGHEHCGAVGAALGKDKPGGNLGKLISEIHVGKDLPGDKSAAMTAAVKNNANYQAKIMTDRSDVLKKAVDDKHIRIVSGVYSLSTGKVEWLTAK